MKNEWKNVWGNKKKHEKEKSNKFRLNPCEMGRKKTNEMFYNEKKN